MLCTAISAASPVVSLTDLKVERAVSPFVGTYVLETASGEEQATLIVKDGRVEFWHTVRGVPWRSFSIPLSQFGKQVEGLRPNGVTLVNFERRAEVDDRSLSVTESLIGKIWRREETQSISKIGGEITFIRKRKTFRRRFMVFGDWVETGPSLAVLRYRQNVIQSMIKLSDRPIPPVELDITPEFRTDGEFWKFDEEDRTLSLGTGEQRLAGGHPPAAQSDQKVVSLEAFRQRKCTQILERPHN